MAKLQFRLLGVVSRMGKLSGKKVYYARPVHHGRISFDELCKRVSRNTTVGAPDVKAVLSHLATEIPDLLSLGYSVECGELGTFRASFSSKAVEDPKAFKLDLIHTLRVIFTPHKFFKDALRKVGFELAPDTEGKPKKPTPKKPGGSSSNPPSGGGIGI